MTVQLVIGRNSGALALIFRAIKPAEFDRCLLGWITSLDEQTAGQLVAIDGNTCRGSRDAAKGLGALHIVGAWAGEEGIAPGQVATDAGSNEITAIPQLLE